MSTFLSFFVIMAFLASPVLPAAQTEARPSIASPAQIVVKEAGTVKAAYVYNLAKFVDWSIDGASPAAERPITICILGKDTVSAMLNQVASLRAKGRPIEVRHLEEGGAIPSCHILYLAASQQGRIDQIIPRIPEGVLTVSDIPNFAKTCGMVGFVSVDQRVVIEINVHRAQSAGLKLSSKLLEISRLVPREQP